MPTKLILASSSPYRKSLLSRLNIPFSSISPDIDETIHPDETANEAVARLAKEKSHRIAQKTPQEEPYIIIGSDQVAVLDESILGKPGNIETASSQLASFSGKKIDFLTGLCVLNSQTLEEQTSISCYSVYFRELSQEEILSYLKAEQPFDCAGSFKCEGLGISLFEKMEGSDPNSLIGLPLINLCNALRNMGINPLTNINA